MQRRTPGQLVRDARRERGISQAELAVRAGTTQSAISRLESDGLSPTVDHLSRLLACLGCDLVLAAEPRPPWADADDLRTWRALDASERLAAAMGTLRQLSRLEETARER